MAEKQYQHVYWTNRAISDSLEIKRYLEKKFSQKEIDNFYKMLEAFEKVVLLFPKLYPKSLRDKKSYRAVLSKQLSVFYILSKDHVTIVAILDNRMGYSKWP